MKARKTVYTKTGRSGPCQYQVFGPMGKTLVACGKPASKYRANHSNHYVCLCAEHAEFFLDARTAPVAEVIDEE